MVAKGELHVAGLQVGRDLPEPGAQGGQLRGRVARVLVEGEDADALLDHEALDVAHAEGVAVGEDGAEEGHLERVDAGQLGGGEARGGVPADEGAEAAGLGLQPRHALGGPAVRRRPVPGRRELARRRRRRAQHARRRGCCCCWSRRPRNVGLGLGLSLEVPEELPLLPQREVLQTFHHGEESIVAVSVSVSVALALVVAVSGPR